MGRWTMGIGGNAGRRSSEYVHRNIEWQNVETRALNVCVIVCCCCRLPPKHHRWSGWLLLLLLLSPFDVARVSFLFTFSMWRVLSMCWRVWSGTFAHTQHTDTEAFTVNALSPFSIRMHVQSSTFVIVFEIAIRWDEMLYALRFDGWIKCLRRQSLPNEHISVDRTREMQRERIAYIGSVLNFIVPPASKARQHGQERKRLSALFVFRVIWRVKFGSWPLSHTRVYSVRFAGALLFALSFAAHSSEVCVLFGGLHSPNIDRLSARSTSMTGHRSRHTHTGWPDSSVSSTLCLSVRFAELLLYRRSGSS